jgi:hypothetical protein
MGDTVRLRNVGPVDLLVDGRTVKADCLTEVAGRVVTDVAELRQALALRPDETPNVPADVVHILEPGGQLRAWPKVTWKVESGMESRVTEPKPSKVKE